MSAFTTVGTIALGGKNYDLELRIDGVVDFAPEKIHKAALGIFKQIAESEGVTRLCSESGYSLAWDTFKTHAEMPAQEPNPYTPPSPRQSATVTEVLSDNDEAEEISPESPREAEKRSMEEALDTWQRCQSYYKRIINKETSITALIDLGRRERNPDAEILQEIADLAFRAYQKQISDENAAKYIKGQTSKLVKAQDRNAFLQSEIFKKMLSRHMNNREKEAQKLREKLSKS